MREKILISGGSGFIGSALVRYFMHHTDYIVINVDKLTYAVNNGSLESIKGERRYFFEQIDICNQTELERIFSQYQPDAVLHLAAESHVDRAILGASEFIQSNIVGTYTLLESTLNYWNYLSENKKSAFRFLHVSTDEVYGDLSASSPAFLESSPYAPNNPYSASKAASDHLVRAWGRTYGLPVIITHSSNNYGPYQHSEKFIPKMVINALNHKPLPIYGDGLQIRDWLFVEDHVEALYLVLKSGRIGETYNISANNEWTNIAVVQSICMILQNLVPQTKRYQSLISHVEDRLGHDVRYALDATKISNELGWKPKQSFEKGLWKTVQWYIDHLEEYQF